MNLKKAVITLLIAGGICAGTSAVSDRLNSPSTTHSNRPVLIQPVYAEEELTLEQITKEVQEKTVEEILEGLAEWLDIADIAITPAKYKKSLLLVYGVENVARYRRLALVTKEAISKYKDIKLFAYGVGKFTTNHPIYETLGVTHLPSIVMFSDYNILTHEKNQTSQVVDILKGGPGSDKEAKDEWLTFIKNEWIPTNLVENRGYCWRFNNSSKETKYKLK